MTKRYDWSKLPEGVTVHWPRNAEFLRCGNYDYSVSEGTIVRHYGAAADPDAAAGAYAKLRAAAKTCEVNWRTEWQEAANMTLIDMCDAATLSIDGVRITGHGGRKHRVTVYGPTAAPASAVLRIAKIAEKLEALGWEAG